MARPPSVLRADTNDATILVDCRRGFVELVYLGPALPADEDAEACCDAARRGRHESQPDAPSPRSILPQCGWGYAGTPAIRLSRSGVLLPGRFALVEASASDDGFRFNFEDQVAGLAAYIEWRLLPSGAIVAKTRIANRSDAAVAVDSLASLALPLPPWATVTTRYSGRWAGEMQRDRSRLQSGFVGSASFGGRPGFSGANWVCLEEDTTTEVTGLSLTVHIACSSDSWQLIERGPDGDAVLLIGPRLDTGEVTIAPGESWAPPTAVIAIGSKGRASARQTLHRHIVCEVLPRPQSDSRRKVHINSWEALGFNLDEQNLGRLIDDAARLGVERFVLDDGWFEGRRSDRTGLGDWTVDQGVLPGGLDALIAHVHATGMDFGLWVEPEMVNPASRLYGLHPDWCLHEPRAARPTQRNQLVLDLTRREVADHLFAVLDTLLREHDVAYLKWDHNRDLFPRAGRGQAQARAVHELIDRVRTAHPRLEIETCASGGARVDLAMLSRCTRFWASDNNDAIERLRINQGWFDLLPLKATGNHVGPSPNPITGRRLAMDFRAKVAMFGHMGVEADPASMSENDRASLSAHIALYKKWREVLHAGALSAIGCACPGVCGWLAFDADRGLALVAQTGFAADYNVPPVRLLGLEPAARFRCRLLEPWPRPASRYLANGAMWRDGLVLSGRALGEAGVALPLTHPETAWLIAVEREP